MRLKLCRSLCLHLHNTFSTTANSNSKPNPSKTQEIRKYNKRPFGRNSAKLCKLSTWIDWALPQEQNPYQNLSETPAKSGRMKWLEPAASGLSFWRNGGRSAAAPWRDGTARDGGGAEWGAPVCCCGWRGRRIDRSIVRCSCCVLFSSLVCFFFFFFFFSHVLKNKMRRERD